VINSNENDDSRFSSQPEQLRKILEPYKTGNYQYSSPIKPMNPAEIALQRVQASMTTSIVKNQYSDNSPNKSSGQTYARNNPDQTRYTPYSSTLKDYSDYKSPQATRIDPSTNMFNSSESKKIVPLLSPSEPQNQKGSTVERNINPYSRTV
jgi:hypothetical protein